MVQPLLQPYVVALSCTSSPKFAEMYGHFERLMPKRDLAIAICASADAWASSIVKDKEREFAIWHQNNAKCEFALKPGKAPVISELIELARHLTPLLLLDGVSIPSAWFVRQNAAIRLCGIDHPLNAYIPSPLASGHALMEDRAQLARDFPGWFVFRDEAGL